MMRWSLIEKIVGVKIAVGFHNTIYMVINPAYSLCSYTGRKCEDAAQTICLGLGNHLFCCESTIYLILIFQFFSHFERILRSVFFN